MLLLEKTQSTEFSILAKIMKAGTHLLTRGRTDHFSNSLASHEFSALWFLISVSNSGTFSATCAVRGAVTGFSKFHFHFKVKKELFILNFGL